MLFASFPYILLFLPLVVIVCIALRKLAGPRAAQVWIVAASTFFYAKSHPSNLIYLALSILANWAFAHLITKSAQPAKKRLLVLALGLNVVYLSAFKYLGFFASLFAFVLPHGFQVPTLPFPLGISFFTITQIMYLIDCYEETLSAGSLLDHASFVTFFPYLISGPLGRAKRMRHQFGNFGGQKGARANLMARGVYLFSIGLFKKAVLANSFAQVVDFGNTTATNMSSLESWIFSIAYALDVYFDFSGYSDMAIGSALMLGIEIPRNFDRPFSSKSIIEFWQRWHISLTQFITAYLYTPILRAFKKRTLFTAAIATFLAMGIAGLWHGAAWTFVIYGFLHGTYLGINQYWRKKNMPHIPAFPSWLLTFVCVVISLIYFGASSVPEANARVIALFNPHNGFATHNILNYALLVDGVGIRVIGLPLLASGLIAFFGPASEEMGRDFKPTTWNCIYAVGITLVAFIMINSIITTPFVYFRF